MHKIGFCVLMMPLLLLTACGGGGNEGEEEALAIRTEYIAMTACAGQAEIVADYGQRTYTYTLSVEGSQEETTLTVLEPELISGMTASIAGEETSLSYDGAILETGLLTEDGLSPMSAVPVLLEYAKNGFIDGCATETLGEQETLHVCYRDPAQAVGEGVEADLWFDRQTHSLVRGELAQDSYTVIVCTFTDFTFS